uniref:Uncharacterized protein n=1 Tax=Zea mays TaxID=4577 RepID=C4IZ03_MAIZE|nr:unknown [Zea mays]
MIRWRPPGARMPRRRRRGSTGSCLLIQRCCSLGTRLGRELMARATI